MVRISLGQLLGNFELDTGDPYVSFGSVGGGVRTQTKVRTCSWNVLFRVLQAAFATL